MRFGPSISVLLLTATSCMSTPTKGSIVGEGAYARAISGSQLYGCTRKNFGGHCETTIVDTCPIYSGQTGVCTPTTGMFRNNLISVRAVRYGAYLYQGDNCSGPYIWVDTEGWGNIGDTMYRSYNTPTPCLPPRCSPAA
ncbi:hypothetical protein AG1IA_04237 [Rhizoctonia solani AG-1 IA]|uniref:Uncharacterized protein n=1 Tax=Thanatephorus cucumeris (strain AG1-IA) TaxID=983506 RepID=L8WUR8_THACA|nr:hypothetical protein AG1IA_04237 [Rhizoctonia solani AG-1 IA]